MSSKNAVKLLGTVGKVAVSIPIVTLRTVQRWFRSLLTDIACLVLGPRNLYQSTEPKGWKWTLFVIRVIAL